MDSNKLIGFSFPEQFDIIKNGIYAVRKYFYVFWK